MLSTIQATETKSWAKTKQPSGEDTSSSKLALWLAWAVTLTVSLAPNILFQESTGQTPAWLFMAKLALLGAMIVVGLFWSAARPLCAFCIMFAVLFLMEDLRGRLEASAQWHQWFGGFGATFATRMLGQQLLRVGVAIVMIVVLLILQYRPRDFFLTKGDLNGTAAPVRWLGINKPMGWRRLGIISSLCISLGLLAFLLIGGGRPSWGAARRVLPMLPMVLILAAMNAFAEEVSFRSVLLGSLRKVVDQRQAVLLTAAFFGIAHYYGVPYGLVGVVMAGFLGWFLGKCMTETKGLFWPWLIHFLQDVLIFSFMAIGAVTPGGK
jgi:membrane protease YdiL (CAAX protease family)